MIPLLYPCSIDGSGKNGILWVIHYTVYQRESLVQGKDRVVLLLQVHLDRK